MADWNAYEARIRDRALAEAVNALIAAGQPAGAVSAIEQLRTKPARLPIPPIGRKRVYGFADMAVGDHLDMPRDMGADPYGRDLRQKSVLAAASKWAKRHNPDARFATRLIDNDTVRYWRVS